MRIETLIKKSELVEDNTMFIDARVYEIIPYEELATNLGEDDGEWILKRQHKISARFIELEFVLPDWLHPYHDGHVAHLVYKRGLWVKEWYWKGSIYYFPDTVRLLRRIL